MSSPRKHSVGPCSFPYWNCGVEGPTDDPAVLELRARQRRNFLATLLLSEGVPLLLGGDELGRSQRGNNNGYCQDNPISWVDWSLVGTPPDLSEFVRSLCRFRLDHPILRRRRFFSEGEITWVRPDGFEMTDEDWTAPFARALAVTSTDQRFLLLVNAWWESLTFRIPSPLGSKELLVVIDTSAPGPAKSVGRVDGIALAGRSLMLLEALVTSEAGGMASHSRMS